MRLGSAATLLLVELLLAAAAAAAGALLSFRFLAATDLLTEDVLCFFPSVLLCFSSASSPLVSSHATQMRNIHMLWAPPTRQRLLSHPVAR